MYKILKLIIIWGFVPTSIGYSQVGINTTNPSQGAQLDVNGNVIVKYPDEIKKETDYSFLFTNTATGEVKQSSSLEKPFYFLNLRLRCWKNKGAKKWESFIKSMNTRIPNTKNKGANVAGYFAFITQSTLRRVRDNTPAFISHSSAKADYNPIKQVYLYEKDTDWFLRADYPSGTMVANGIEKEEPQGYYWDIYILAIKKEHIKHIKVPDPNNPNEEGFFTTDNNAIAKANDYVINKLNEATPQNVKVLPEVGRTHTSTGLVGIMTTTPTTELDINGKLFIKEPKKANIRELYPLVLDKKKQTLSALSAYNKPFTFISGKIDTGANIHQGNEDYIGDFDTRIPVSTHTLIPLMSVLRNERRDKEGNKVIGVTHGVNDNVIGGKEVGNAQENISIWKKKDRGGETWRYTADYHRAQVLCGDSGDPSTNYWYMKNREKHRKHFYWEYKWMAISNIFVENLGTLYYELEEFDGDDVLPVPRGDHNLIKYMSDEERKNPGKIHKL